MFLPLTPTAHVPLFTASDAYSTWKTCPSGLPKTLLVTGSMEISSLSQFNYRVLQLMNTYENIDKALSYPLIDQYGAYVGELL